MLQESQLRRSLQEVGVSGSTAAFIEVGVDYTS